MQNPTVAQLRLFAALVANVAKLDRAAVQKAIGFLQSLVAEQKSAAEPPAITAIELCDSWNPVTQLVDYAKSFEGRDAALKLTYRDPNITDANFKVAGVLEEFEQGVVLREFMVYRPIRKISAKQIIELLKGGGYRPATALELLEYYAAQLLTWQPAQCFGLVAFGTLLQENVVSLDLLGHHHTLKLYPLAGDWSGCHILTVRESE